MPWLCCVQHVLPSLDKKHVNGSRIYLVIVCSARHVTHDA
jgi:hypothetical protein